jgi:hypothetical protein
MKRIAFQLIASGVAMVVMAGAVGLHWWRLGSTTAGVSQERWLVLSGSAWSEGDVVPVSTGGSSAGSVDRGNPLSTEAPRKVDAVTVQALQEVVSVLQDMKTENENLRAQLMETNREMNGMQIRLDGYDDSFRPLKLAPTAEGVIDSGNPLLPPKRW